jgi:hypothetical protein
MAGAVGGGRWEVTAVGTGLLTLARQYCVPHIAYCLKAYDITIGIRTVNRIPYRNSVTAGITTIELRNAE